MVTGGAGFIGSNLVRKIIETTNHKVINVDKLTYAGNLASLSDIESDSRYTLEQVDIVDAKSVSQVFEKHQPDAVVHLAAESHVDRSIDGPSAFIQTNIVGTYNLLAASKAHWESLTPDKKDGFRFHHVSTDEVYGSLESDEAAFTESTRYDPHSPYAATKASSDHLVRAWSTTYGLPVLVSSCSNNYGPFQFPEKLIPHVILKAIHGETIPIYGDGSHVRDWIYVDDHVDALLTVLENGKPGETYNVGGGNERSNLDVVKSVCRILDRIHPIEHNSQIQPDLETTNPISQYEALIENVSDRPGHDFRYASNAAKMGNELGWNAKEKFESGLEKTVRWYLDNSGWWKPLLSSKYQLQRLGISGS